MYNRYIRNDQGTYTRITEEEESSARTDSREQQPAERPAPPPGCSCGQGVGSPDGVLRHLLDQLHLNSIDTGDLLLLGLLFFLYREHADEELLLALGLLLIL